MNSGSGLRVAINLALRGNRHAAGCTRWFLRFNGDECADPVTMEMIDYRDIAVNYIQTMESERQEISYTHASQHRLSTVQVPYQYRVSTILVL